MVRFCVGDRSSELKSYLTSTFMPSVVPALKGEKAEDNLNFVFPMGEVGKLGKIVKSYCFCSGEFGAS